jgi:Zn-finger nucleic acid-binding protein
MRCPNCDSRLVELDRSEILIDACPECRGVWLDRGELDRILERERRALVHGDPDEDFFAEMSGRREQPRPEPRAEPRPEERRDRERGYDDESKKRKRRKSLLEDLLDF